MKLKLILCLCMLPLFCLAQEAQPQQFSNRYGMKMTQNEDGSYALLYAKKYAKFIDVNTIPDVMVPYTYQPDRLKSKDYKGVATKDIVYKKHKDYELILTVDFAETDKPAPFVVYIHGGGWARGDNGSSRSLSQYLAKQKGITGVRVSYTLAPQSDATVKVSIQDILDAVKYVQEHAAELNVNPACVGFLGTSAGAHLAAVAAMTVPGTKALVGYSGIYDLEKAAITMKTKDAQKIAENVVQTLDKLVGKPKEDGKTYSTLFGKIDKVSQYEVNLYLTSQDSKDFPIFGTKHVQNDEFSYTLASVKDKESKEKAESTLKDTNE